MLEPKWRRTMRGAHTTQQRHNTTQHNTTQHNTTQGPCDKVLHPRSLAQGPWAKDVLPKSLAQSPKTRGPRDAVQCSGSNSSRAALCAVSVRRVEHPLPPLSVRLLSILFFKFVCHLLNQTLGSNRYKTFMRSPQPH
jgi:hypothetical protein